MADTGRTVFADNLWADGFFAAGLWATTAPVTVPDVVGETQAQGITDIEAVGLSAVVTTSYDPIVTIGIIISQLPLGGTDVAPGSTINIVVSLGPQPIGGSNPGSPAGGHSNWSGKFEFSKRKKKEVVPDINLKALARPLLKLKKIESDPALAKELSIVLSSKLDDDEEVIAAVLEYESNLISQFISRLQ